MSLTSESTYQEVKDKVLAYERSTTRWQPNSALPSSRASPSETAQPMEIDQISKGDGKHGRGGRDRWDKGGKGKGKSGGKDKGKGGKGKFSEKQHSPASSPSNSPKTGEALLLPEGGAPC